jgi:Cyclic nucleotide-binding domain
VPVTSIHLVLEGRLEEERNGHAWAVRAPYELVGGVDALAHAGERLVVRATAPTQTLELERDDLLEVCGDRFGVLATVATGVAAMAIAARRRLGPAAGFAAADADVPAACNVGPGAGLAGIVACLRTMPAIAETPVHTLAYVAAESELVTIERGQTIWRAGDPAAHVLLVLSGAVRCTSEDDSQGFVLGPGEVTGALDALAMVPRWYTASARSTVGALRIRATALLDVLEDDPDTAVQALVRLACATSALIDRVADERHPGV